MLHAGDATYEAEHRMREAGRVLAERERQAGRLGLPASRPRLKLKVREAYYRQLANLGRQACDLGLEVGCAMEARAVANGRSGT
jgi:hypothetical protein